MRLYDLISVAVIYVAIAFWAWDIVWILTLGDLTFVDRIFLSAIFIGSLAYNRILMEEDD
jgi:hypothetical protein